MSGSELRDRVCEHLQRIYPDEDLTNLAAQLLDVMSLAEEQPGDPHCNHWDERDAVVITYGDTFIGGDEHPLATLREFLAAELNGVVSVVHILPFFPYSSDDGFAVIDYSSVNEALGDWRDVAAIAGEFKVMADVVINHMSSRGQWFENYKQDLEPGRDYFIEAPADADLTAVVRPRTSPLLAPVETLRGTRHVWCTFSHDQVDMNFANPRVLIEFARILRQYLDEGIRWFRLDAVAFLWKEIGTSCIHLPQTHEIVKLLRLLVETAAPGAVIVTETNVPNRENLTYFGNGNEAHVIYNFSLPPLIIHTLISGDCRHLKTWQMTMPPAMDGTAYLNFIASHDGIGVRPAEGLLSNEELDNLIETMQRFGGQVTYRHLDGATQKPYEINIALIDALAGTVADGPDEFRFDRYLCAHTIMLALEGIPAFYIHSLLATPNDHERVANTGRLRSINRHQWDIGELRAALSDERSIHKRALDEIRRRLAIRRQQRAFHPNATQYTLHFGKEIFGFWRQSARREQSIFALHNVTNTEQMIALGELNLINTENWVELLSDRDLDDLHGELVLPPYGAAWLTNYHARRDVG